MNSKSELAGVLKADHQRIWALAEVGMHVARVLHLSFHLGATKGHRHCSRRLDHTVLDRPLPFASEAEGAGFTGPELKAEMDEPQAHKESLLAQLATADAPVPLLHPNLAALYREKVATLASALQNADSPPEASEALRCLVDAIVLVPAGTAK